MTQGQVAQAMGCLLRDRYPDVPEIPEAVERCYSEQTTLRHELRFRTRETRKVKDLVLTYAYAPADFVVIYTEDITARKQAEEQRQLLISLIENSADFIGLASMDRRSTYVNKAGLAMVGLDSMEEAGKKKVDDFLLEDDHARFEQEIMPVLMEGKTWRGEFRLGHFKTGKPIPIDANVFIIQNEADGQPVAIATVSRDITARKRAETALRTSEERFRILFESSPLPTYVWQRKDDDFVLTGYNAAGAVITRESVEMGVGSVLSEIYRDRPDIIEHFERCFTSREPLRQETTYRFQTTGEVRDLAMYYAYVPPDLVMMHTEDVTERKRAQEALRKSEEKFATAFRSSPVSVMIIAFEGGRLLDVNKRFLNVTGYRYEEVVGSTTRVLELWDDPREHARMAELVRRQVKLRNFETDFRTKTGEVRTGWLSLSLIDLDGEPCLLSVLRDITKQKQAEAALRTSEETARALLNAYDDVAFLMDTEGVLLLANHSLAQRFDKQIEELLGSNVYDLSPPQIARCRRAYAEEVVRTGKPDRFQDGRAGRLFDSQVYPVMDAEGKVARLAVYTRDITEQAQMEENLRKSEERFRALFQGVPLPTYVWQRKDDDFVLAGYNAASEVFTEGGVETVVGSVLSEMYRDRPDIIEHFERCFASREPLRQEMSYRLRTTGEVRDLAVYYAYVPPDLVMMHTEDVTERKRAQEALRESEEKFRTIVETSTDWIWEMDLEWRHAFSNRRYEDILGYSWKAIADQDIFALFHPEDRVVIEERLPGLIENQAGWQNWVVRFRHKDGSYRFLESSAVPILDADGKLIGYRGVDRDITARKLVEDKLRLSEERCRAIVEDQTELISRFKADGTLTFINEAACRYVGLPREQLIGKSFFYMLPPDYREELQNMLASLGPDNPVVEMENQVVLPDGRVRWTQWINRAILDEADTVVEFQAVGRDITERKQVEEALRESEEKFRTIVETSTGWIWEMDLEWRYTFSNRRYEDILGYTPEAIADQDIFALFHPEDRVVIEERLPGLIENQAGWQNWVVRFRHKDGSYRFLESSAVPILDADGKLVGYRGVDRDITARKRAEDKLRASEARLAEAQRIAHLGSWDWNINANILHWSDEVHRIFGVTLQTFGATYEAFLSFVHPADRPAVMEQVDAALEQHAPYSTEHRVVRPDGGQRVVWERGVVTFDEADRPVRMVGTVLDITERKQAEEALRASEKRNRAMVEAMPDLMFRVTTDGTFLDYKAEADRLLMAPDEIVGSTLADSPMPSDVVEAITRAMRQAVETGEVATLEYELAMPNGLRFFEARVVKSGDEEVIAFVRNITERKEAEEALRESEERLQLATEAAKIGCFDWHLPEGQLHWDTQMHKLFGLHPQSTIDRADYFNALLHPDDKERVVAEFGESMDPENGETVFRSEFKVVLEEGLEKHIESHAIHFKDESGVVKRIIGTCLDITERKQMEAELRKSEERLRQVIENMPVLLDAFDEAGHIVTWNKECERVTGYSAEEVIGEPEAIAWLYPDAVYRERMITELERQGSDFRDWEWELVSKTGQVKTVAWSNISEHFPISGWASWGIGVDVTERRQAEENLRASQERFKALFQGIPIPTFVWQQKDDEIIFVDYNVAAESFTQRRVEEYQGIRLAEMYAGRPDIIEDIKRCLTDRETIRREMSYRFSTGKVWDLAVHYAFVPPDLVMLHTEDITERRRAERALRESEARLREAQHMAHLGSWEFDVATETLLWSDEMYAIHGISQEVSAGDLIEAGKRAIHPDDLEVLLASIERTMAGESPSEHEFRVVHPDGTERVVLGRATCTWDDEGRPIRLAGTVQDITERKQAEEALRHYAERLKVLHIIDQAILNAHSSEEIARAVIPHLPAILPIGCAGVWVFDFEANEARLLATLLEEQAPLCAGAAVPLSDLGNIEAFRQGRETLIHDTTQAEGLSRGDRALMEDGWRSILCVPLRVQDGIVGIIKAVSRRPHIFTADHVAIAYEVADELGVALHSIRLFEEVSVARQRLMQLSRRLAMVQEEERRLLARELHDEVGGLLTALQISLKMNPAKEEEARRELHEASLLVDSLIEQARQLALKLRPAVLDDMGLVAALHWLFERYTARVKVEVDFHNEVPPDTRFAPEVETTVYRITQEALTNVARHTGVKRVQVLLHVEAQHLALHVIDEGNGFDVKEALAHEKTLGVSGMRERAALLGGTLTIESDSGVGTCVSALLPLE